jgi:hypothetical protein
MCDACDDVLIQVMQSCPYQHGLLNNEHVIRARSRIRFWDPHSNLQLYGKRKLGWKANQAIMYIVMPLASLHSCSNVKFDYPQCMWR